MLKKDPTSKYKNKLVNILRSWNTAKKISPQLYRKIYPTSEQIPKFYGLPKIHKKDTPLKPIVSSIGCISYPAAKFLSSVLNPLKGKTKHSIKNSEDFVKKIEGLEIPPPRVLVSYDVSALFTSIPIEEAIRVIHKRLSEDETLPDRCELDVEQIMTLLRFCLETTYFVCNGVFYRQVQGAPMGSPVSPAVADLMMEEFEERALQNPPVVPSVWFRYVDDTFTVLPQNRIEEFTNYLNSQNRSIQFTIEEEEDCKLAFLDTCIERLEDGSLKVNVYRKPTHTDQYLNWESNHHLEHKRSVVRTLLRRAEHLVTDEEDRRKEISHVKRVLKINGYKPWAFKIPPKKNKEPTEPSESTSKKFPVKLPYIKGASEAVQRVLKNHGIPSFHKPFNTIRNLLVRPKDKNDPKKTCGIIYNISCPSCKETYIGETGRNLETRLKEHLDPKSSQSAVQIHTQSTGHLFNQDSAKIIGREDNKHRRKILEAIEIHKHQPQLNLNQGKSIPRHSSNCCLTGIPPVRRSANVTSLRKARRSHFC